MKIEIFYSDHYTLQLPKDHRFPMEKYELLRNFLLSEKILTAEHLKESPLASFEELHLAHCSDYIRSFQDGTVEPEIIKRIGFPWSNSLYTRSCATVGGALAATKSALKNGISGNLAGGTHHSHCDRGEGYCVFNDIAVATRYLQKHRLSERIAIIDLDVHQGNGNSSILGNDPNVFVFSMHGEKNYPFKKVPSHLDIALRENCEDNEYLEKLQFGLRKISEFQPDYIFYQMGVDPLKEDLLGKMALSFEGLKTRDLRVLEFAKAKNIPCSLALGGGYARPIELSVRAYANTYRVLKEVYFSGSGASSIDSPDLTAP